MLYQSLVVMVDRVEALEMRDEVIERRKVTVVAVVWGRTWVGRMRIVGWDCYWETLSVCAMCDVGVDSDLIGN